MARRVSVSSYAGHITRVSCVAGPSNVSATAPLSADCCAIAYRAMDDMVILAHTRDQHRLSMYSYGRPRMTEELQELGLEVGHRRVGRLMRDNCIKTVRTRKFKATTDSNHSFNIAPNLLDQDFSADAPNQKWAGPSRDIPPECTAGQWT